MSRSNKSRLSSQPLHRLRKPARPRNQGIALVITLILLALLGAISLALVLLVSSDAMINGYYRNYRGSFYAADSGVNVVVEAIENAAQTTGNQSANPPLPINGTIPATMTSAYAPYQSGYYNIGDTGSWKGQFEMVANPGGTAVIGTPTYTESAVASDSNSHYPCTPSCDGDYQWTFSYPYTVTIKGQSSGTEAEEITETGVITYSSISGSAGSAGLPSFAKWGAFITNFSACQGPLVPGTATGPFFTDGQWNFGNDSNPGYTFTDSIGQVGAQASWFSNNNCTNSASAPRGFTQPNFVSGFQESQNTITPPSDNYNQMRAVLDAEGTTDSQPSQTMMSQELKNISGTAYPASGTPPTGVYIPYYTTGSGSSAHNVFGANTAPPLSSTTGAAGGFYINGNATVTLSASTGGDGTSNPTQTYTITQGSTTTTIIVDNTASTTTVKSGSTTLSLSGVPEQLDGNGNPITQTDPSGNTVNPTLIYVNGQITGMSGTVQNDVGAMVTASSDISLTGDITYKTSPVSIPSDTLNTSTDAGVLGIFTTGNINLYANSSGSNAGNLTVNASLAALSGGTSGFETPGNSGINTWTIVGGRSEDQAHSVNINAGNTYYDRRFANNFGPPWFPTAVPGAGYNPIASSETLKITRASWQEVSRP